MKMTDFHDESDAIEHIKRLTSTLHNVQLTVTGHNSDDLETPYRATILRLVNGSYGTMYRIHKGTTRLQALLSLLKEVEEAMFARYMDVPDSEHMQMDHDGNKVTGTAGIRSHDRSQGIGYGSVRKRKLDREEEGAKDARKKTEIDEESDASTKQPKRQKARSTVLDTSKPVDKTQKVAVEVKGASIASRTRLRNAMAVKPLAKPIKSSVKPVPYPIVDLRSDRRKEDESASQTWGRGEKKRETPLHGRKEAGTRKGKAMGAIVVEDDGDANVRVEGKKGQLVIGGVTIKQEKN